MVVLGIAKSAFMHDQTAAPFDKRLITIRGSQLSKERQQSSSQDVIELARKILFSYVRIRITRTIKRQVSISPSRCEISELSHYCVRNIKKSFPAPIPQNHHYEQANSSRVRQHNTSEGKRISCNSRRGKLTTSVFALLSQNLSFSGSQARIQPHSYREFRKYAHLLPAHKTI